MMITVDFTLTSDDEDFRSYIIDQYEIVKNAVEDSNDVELTTTFESLFNGTIDSFSDTDWSHFPIPQLTVKEKAMLGLGFKENTQNPISYSEFLREYMDLLIKKITIYELQPDLIINPNQSDVEEADKLVRLKIEFKK